MPDLYGTDLSVNSLKTKESSRFGTRPLAFYTFVCDTTSGLADFWQDSNSLYSQVVRALQDSGIELYWLGEPLRQTSPFTGSDAFTFAINDDADSPQKYLESSYTYTVLGANLDDYNNYIKLNTGVTFNRGQPIVFGMTDDGVTAGKTYYVEDQQYANGATYIRLSETVTQVNTDGTPDYPEGVGHPGEIFQLDPAPSSNSYTATVYYYDTSWSGTAGDVQWSCCWDPDYKLINAWNLDYLVGNILNGAAGSFNILRSQVQAYGIYPSFGCCC
jgi:hypothetical protein